MKQPKMRDIPLDTMDKWTLDNVVSIPNAKMKALMAGVKQIPDDFGDVFLLSAEDYMVAMSCVNFCIDFAISQKTKAAATPTPKPFGFSQQIVDIGGSVE